VLERYQTAHPTWSLRDFAQELHDIANNERKLTAFRVKITVSIRICIRVKWWLPQCIKPKARMGPHLSYVSE
jgi:hypothetical protein